MESELRPGADFYAAVARMRKAPPEIRKALNTEIRSATKPIEKAAKQNVLDIESRGVSGGGGNARGLANAARSKKGARGKTGLRQSIAAGVQTKITYSGRRTGVRVRVDGSKMPVDQRALIKATNKGTVRHPVFGNRNTWTTQQFTPLGWFDRATRQYGAEAIQEIKRAATEALRKLG